MPEKTVVEITQEPPQQEEVQKEPQLILLESLKLFQEQMTALLAHQKDTQTQELLQISQRMDEIHSKLSNLQMKVTELEELEIAEEELLPAEEVQEVTLEPMENVTNEEDTLETVPVEDAKQEGKAKSLLGRILYGG